MKQHEPRNYHFVTEKQVQGFIATIKRIASEESISVSDVLKAWEIQERERRNNLYAANGDYFDEQMYHLGTAVESLASEVGRIEESISTMANNSSR